MDLLSRTQRGLAARGGLLALAVCVGAAGCATSGAVPRPFPTPAERRAPAPTPAESLPPDALGSVPESIPQSPQGLLHTALTMLGIPYHAGGQTPDTGFDCSGFVAWVFGQHGRALPRTVTGQFGLGEPVGATFTPMAGDLVFFATESPRVSHVGIALGDGRFVHAPNSHGVVRIESLAAAYWSRRYLGARRVLRM